MPNKKEVIDKRKGNQSTFNIKRSRRMLRLDGYLMRGSAEIGEGDDLVSVGRTKARKLCHRLVSPTGVDAEEAEAP